MRRYIVGGIVLAIMATGATLIASGPARTDSASVLAAQREAITRFASMDGEWRGSAWIILPSGEKHPLTQTERVGSFLDGTVKVIEGRGYESDGSVGFNALAIISYDPASHTYTMRSYAKGRVGDFSVTPNDDGFQWEFPAGPFTMRYSAKIKDGIWTEIGERIKPGSDPIRFYEMNLSRIGQTSWPADGAISPH